MRGQGTTDPRPTARDDWRDRTLPQSITEQEQRWQGRSGLAGTTGNDRAERVTPQSTGEKSWVESSDSNQLTLPYNPPPLENTHHWSLRKCAFPTPKPVAKMSGTETSGVTIHHPEKFPLRSALTPHLVSLKILNTTEGNLRFLFQI